MLRNLNATKLLKHLPSIPLWTISSRVSSLQTSQSSATRLMWPPGSHHPCTRGGRHGKILESNMWNTQTGDTCHVLLGISIIQRFLNHWHVAHIPCFHIILSDISKPWHFETSDLESLYTCTLQLFGTRNSWTSLSSRVHIVQLLPTDMVAHGMSRKGPCHHWWHQPSTLVLLFFLGTSGFDSLCMSTHQFSQLPNSKVMNCCEIFSSKPLSHISDGTNLSSLHVTESCDFSLNLGHLSHFAISTTLT